MRKLARSPSAIVLLTAIAFALFNDSHAQTPAQMEYERQQREYARQQEQQRQEQQRQQQLMNDNARRQQEESARLNAPSGQAPTPSNRGNTSQQTAPGRSAPQTYASTATKSSKWVALGSFPVYGGLDIYSDPVTMLRSGDVVKMWEMWDFKSPQVIAGDRVLSSQNLYEYDCKSGRRRMLASAGFSEHMGKITVVDTGYSPTAWEAVISGNYAAQLRDVACAKK